MGTEETNNEWCEVDFKPAPPGWLVVFNDGRTVPMVGWLVSELRGLHPGESYWPVSLQDDPPANRRRKITAAVMDSAGHVTDATDHEMQAARVKAVAPPASSYEALR